MKILYGVQSTGHGHLVRSTPVIQALRAHGHDVHVLISGPAPGPGWLERIGKPLDRRRGLTFSVVAGEIRYLRTMLSNRPLRFLRDLASLRGGDWDMIVSDYEPISAWHARLSGHRAIGIGHLYAFAHDVPMARGNPLNRLVLRQFAPVDLPVGSHWDSFGAPILPPFIAPEVRELERGSVDEHLILVYLPWENRSEIVRRLRRFPHFRFRIYDRVASRESSGNVETRPISRHDFSRGLRHCHGIIANAGYTLASEALHLGISLLVKPIRGQVEQESNALALESLGLGTASRHLSTRDIANWLSLPAPGPRSYPDVTGSLTQWLADGAREPLQQLSRRLWQQAGPAQGAS
ncbi:MAG: hypothetical protein JJT85_01785 [Chromatiales bacterium]|nr:hypothetical protein [Chromatiales bacterium]